MNLNDPQSAANEHHTSENTNIASPQDDLGDKKLKEVEKLALEFQRSKPSSREANQIYTRLRGEIGFLKENGFRPKSNPEHPLSAQEYDRVLEDTIQDTELRLVSFIREDFNPSRGNLQNFTRTTVKHRYGDNAREHRGQYFYSQDRQKKIVSVTSTNLPLHSCNHRYEDESLREIQDNLAQEDSVTYHYCAQREALISLIYEDPGKIFSSIIIGKSMNVRASIDNFKIRLGVVLINKNCLVGALFVDKNFNIRRCATLQYIALLWLQYGYNHSEIATTVGVNQSSISRILKKLQANPLLAEIKQLLNLE